MALKQAEGHSRREFLRRAGQTAVGAAAAYALAPAQDAEAAQAVTDVEAGLIGRKAGEYSDSGDGVAIIAFVGDDAVNLGYSPEAVGDALVQYLRHAGAEAKAFVGYNGDKPTAITFLTLNNGFGPFGVNDALNIHTQVAQEFKNEREVAPYLSSQLD